jgi:predicted dehydrogenase
MDRNTLGIGIIGLSPLTYAHQQAVTEMTHTTRPVAFCDINEKLAVERAAAFGARVYTDYRLLLDDTDVDVVFIVLPHHLHYEVARTALAHGKHVMMEKPLTIRPADGLELIELSRRKGLKFMVAENTRFVKAYIELEKLLCSGTLGKILLVRTFIAGTEVHRMVDRNNWKGRKDGSGGGVIIDAGPHSFYLLKWLFGEIRELRATAYKITEASEVEDNAVITGSLTSGTLFTVEFSFTVNAPWTERLEVYGTEGSVIIDQLNNPPAVHYRGENDFVPAPLADVPFENLLWKYYSIVDETKVYLKSVQDDLPVPIDLMDVYYATVAIEKSYESVRTGTTVQMI